MKKDRAEGDATPPPVEGASRELDKHFCDALDGDRQSALQVWQEVAEGNLNEEHRYWVRVIADSLLKADQLPESERAAAIVRAVRMSGKLDRHRELRERAVALDGFGFTRDQSIDHMHEEGLVDPETQDTRSLLDRELRKGRTRRKKS